MKICLVSSAGGHLFMLSRLRGWWGDYERFWVVKDEVVTRSLLSGEKRYYGNFPENRRLDNFFKNLWLALKILRKEKPDLVFSTGAGIAPPFYLAAKIMRIKTIFLETFIFTARKTLSGRIIYYLADVFLVQNKALLASYPKAKYWGSCL